ncbi:hypothetical protein ACROYT_G003268 [Oculina patagonica]
MKILVVLCFAFLMVYATHGTRTECTNSEASQARCLHGGTCVLNSRPDGTTELGCRCVRRFKGKHCEMQFFWRTGVLGG